MTHQNVGTRPGLFVRVLDKDYPYGGPMNSSERDCRVWILCRNPRWESSMCGSTWFFGTSVQDPDVPSSYGCRTQTLCRITLRGPFVSGPVDRWYTGTGPGLFVVLPDGVVVERWVRGPISLSDTKVGVTRSGVQPTGCYTYVRGD